MHITHFDDVYTHYSALSRLFCSGFGRSTGITKVTNALMGSVWNNS